MSLISSIRPSFNAIKASFPVLGASALAFLPRVIAEANTVMGPCNPFANLSNQSLVSAVCNTMYTSPCPPITDFSGFSKSLSFSKFSPKISSSTTGCSFFNWYNIAIPVATFAIGMLYVYVKGANRPRRPHVKDLLIDWRILPEVINFHIQNIEEDFKEGKIVHAFKLLDRIFEETNKFANTYRIGVNFMRIKLKSYEEDLKTIRKIRRYLKSNRKEDAKKVLKELKIVKIENDENLIDVGNILAFKKEKIRVKENLRNLCIEIVEYKKEKKKFTEDISKLLLIKMIKKDEIKGNDDFIEFIPKFFKDIKKHMNARIKNQKGLVDAGCQTDPEETDVLMLS